jgi:hypothetical protein
MNKKIITLSLLVLAFIIVFGGLLYLNQFSKEKSPSLTINPSIKPTATEENLTEGESQESSPSEREMVSAVSIYQPGQLSEGQKELLSHFSWPKLKPFKSGDKTREVYLVDCRVTNDKVGISLTGIPKEVPNVSNIAEITLKEMVKTHLGLFPDPQEISRYEKINGWEYKNDDSGINSVSLKDGILTINFYDSVAAYGGGSSRVGCMSAATWATAMQFPSIKGVDMCIDKSENCELDFQP